MAESTIWWLFAGLAIAVELLTGTFYLIMLSSGLVGAAIAAHWGATVPVQLVVAALVGGGSVVAWRSYKKRQLTMSAGSTHEDNNLDIGGILQVDAWNEDGTSTAKYRGATWDVSLVAGSVATPGPHRIVEVIGSRLVVQKV